MPAEQGSGRRAYIDWARGLAVLLMIEAHTLDAWTRPAGKHSLAYGRAMLLGGFAAPLFLWLAGLAAALSAVRAAERLGSRAASLEAVCRRGLEIFILAFLFRLQAFVVSPGSYLVTLFRVDILNIMGPAIVFVALVWALGLRPSVLAVVYGTIATAVAMVTPILRSSPAIDTLPLVLQWYIRPFADFTTFTAFPWMGFAFAGAGCGVLLAQLADGRSERRLHAAFAAVGLVLVGVGFYTSYLPSLYRQSSFWSSSPTWFAIRAGIIMTAVSGIYAAERLVGALGWACRPLERLGRHSLFIYWIHIDLVYGYVSWGWRARLPLGGTVAASVVFSVLMYGAAVAKERFFEGADPGRRRAAAQGAPHVDGAMVT